MLLEQLINGIALGASYALVAVGYSMVFGVLRLINFAHGAVYTFGAFTVWTLSSKFHVPLALSIIISIGLTGFLGVLLNKIGLEPLRKKGEPGIPALITTVGISYIIINTLNIVFGAEIKRFPAIFNFGTFNFYGSTISYQQIIIAMTCVGLLIFLSFIVYKTKVGLAMRAVQQQSVAASINGVNVNNVITFTFFLGSASASIAGTLIASYYQYIRPSFADATAMKAFSAAVLGGIGNLAGSMLGGLIVGIIESLAVFKLGSTYIDIVSYSIIFAGLLIKPTGILGKKGIKKV